MSDKWVWFEEYKNCSCTFINADKTKLPGYCPKHATDKKYRIRIPAPQGQTIEQGYVGT